MKYTGKRIAILLTTGLLALNTVGCSNNSRELKTIRAPQTEDIHHNNPYDVKEYKKFEYHQELTIQQFKQLLFQQFLDKSVTIDKKYNKYVYGVYIDGKIVSVELINGETVKGDLNHLRLNNLDLTNLSIFDSKFMTDLNNDTYGGYMYQLEEYDTHQKVELEFSNVSVHGELKLYDNNNMDACFQKGEAFCFLDISDCKKIWLNDFWFSESLQRRINEDQSLECLILTDTDFFPIDNTLTLNVPSLQTLIIDEAYSNLNNLNNIDLKNCTGLKNLKLGANNSSLQNLDGLSGLTSLETISFGQFPNSADLDILSKNFEDKEDEIRQSYSVCDERVSKSNNNLINDISGLKGSNIKILNISSLFHVSSEQLYETVITLPNLQEIVGLSVNNAEMCSEELIAYCDEHSIKHPFTEKSLLIKKELQRIVSELITDDMDDKEKIKVLSKYIIENTEYYSSVANSQKYSSEELTIAWGENLYWTVMEGIGVCAGYSEFCEALFTEAHVTNFIQETIGHAYNLVKVDDTYYQIDLTNLDAYIEYLKIPIDKYQFSINSPYYLIPLEDENSYYSYAEPIEAQIQRERLEEAKENVNEENTSETQKFLKTLAFNNNDKDKTSTNNLLFKIMGILIALGVAIPISKNAAELMVTSGKIKDELSPEQFYRYLIIGQKTKEGIKKYEQQKKNIQNGDER